MPRSLPLSYPTPHAGPKSTAPTATPDASVRSGATLQGTVQVFDPAMCCATGVCGPGIDPALLQIARDLRWLSAQGVTVERVGLSQEPQAFVGNAKVAGLMRAFADGALPAVLVNDAVLAHGRYPTRQEFVDALDVEPVDLPRILAVKDASGGGCTPGSGCC